jgi:ribosomal protein L40E
MTIWPQYGANLNSSTLNFMSDLINILQTLALVMTLLVVLFVLCWIVYAFRKFVTLFNKLIEEMERPRIHVQTTVSAAQPGAPVPTPEVLEEVDETAEIKRYPCHRCNARLPETPTHSVVKDEIAFLVYKCRRCGKETEVDPAKTLPVTENK